MVINLDDPTKASESSRPLVQADSEERGGRNLLILISLYSGDFVIQLDVKIDGYVGANVILLGKSSATAH